MSKLTFHYFMNYDDCMLGRFTTGEHEIPVNIEIENEDVPFFKAGRDMSIEVGAVSGHFRVFADEEEYKKSGHNLDICSIIPVGTFTESEQDSTVLFVGRVNDVEFDAEADDDEPNYTLEIETLDLTVYLSVRYEGEIRAGDIIHASAWLYGVLELPK